MELFEKFINLIKYMELNEANFDVEKFKIEFISKNEIVIGGFHYEMIDEHGLEKFKNEIREELKLKEEIEIFFFIKSLYFENQKIMPQWILVLSVENQKKIYNIAFEDGGGNKSEIHHTIKVYRTIAMLKKDEKEEEETINKIKHYIRTYIEKKSQARIKIVLKSTTFLKFEENFPMRILLTKNVEQ